MGGNSSKPKNIRAVTHKNFIGITSEHIIQDYRMDRVLGQGAYGVVRKAFNRHTEQPVAVKKLTVESEATYKLALKQFKILRQVDHPNIMRVYGMYENRPSHQMLFVTEYVEGGSLLDHLVKSSRPMTEKRVAALLEEVLQGLSYLHAQKIVHRDLKPDNIMLVSKSSGETYAKIVDFGLAAYVTSSLSQGAGTPIYVAPEIVNGKRYKEKVDIWSLGVIAYMLLAGHPPFLGVDREELFQLIRKAQPKYDEAAWKRITPEGLDFVRTCLQESPKSRPSAQSLISHPWIKKFAAQEDISDEEGKEMLTELRRFSGASILQHAVFNYISLTMVSAKQSAQFKEYFQKLDSNNDGTITKTELKKAIQEICGVDASGDLEEIVEGLDANQDGKIEYTEFLAGLLEMHDGVSERQLEQAFDFFDHSNTGYITLSDMQDVLVAAGKVEIQKLWQEILKQVDANHDGKIQFAEFKAILKTDLVHSHDASHSQ